MTGRSAFEDGRAFLYLGAIGAGIALLLTAVLRLEAHAPGFWLLNPNQADPLMLAHGVMFIHFSLVPILFHGFGRFTTGALIDRPPLGWLGPLSFVTLALALFLFVAALLAALAARAEADLSGWRGALGPAAGYDAIAVRFAIFLAGLAWALSALDLLTRLAAAAAAGGAARAYAFSAGGAAYGIAALLSLAAVWLEIFAPAEAPSPFASGGPDRTMLVDLGLAPSGLALVAAAWGAADSATRWRGGAARFEFRTIAWFGAAAMLLFGIGAAGLLANAAAFSPLILAPLLLLAFWIIEAVSLERVSFSFLWAAAAVVVSVFGAVHMGQMMLQGVDLVLHDTYFVVAATHFWLGLCAVFAAFAGWAAFGSELTGRRPRRFWAAAHLGLALPGAMLAIAPMSQLGLAGMPRRYLDYPPQLAELQALASAGAYLFIASFGIFLISLMATRPAR